MAKYDYKATLAKYGIETDSEDKPVASSKKYDYKETLAKYGIGGTNSDPAEDTPVEQAGARNAPWSTGRSGANNKSTASGNKTGVFNNTKTTSAPSIGKAADSGYTQQKAAQQQTANRQTVKDWWKREQQKAAEDDSTERARTAKLTGGANIDNSKEFLENTKKTFGGFQDDADTQRERALQSKMGVGANWGNPKTAVGNAVESAAAGTTASLLNAMGTVLRDDGKRQGLAADSGDIEATETDTWHNRWGKYLQGEADKVQKISDDAYTRGSDGLTNAQKLLFDVGIAGAQMLGDKAFGAAAPIVMAARGFGSGSMQARQEGATHTQQVLYGAASAAVEALTEKMFDGVAHIYGKGAADDVVQKVAEKLAKTPQGQSVIRALMNAGGEGLEEMVSAIVDPALQTIYNDKVINGRLTGEKGAYDDVTIADILYDGLIGALLGFAGGSVDVAQTMLGTGADSAAESAQTAEHEKSSPLIEESGAAESQKAEVPAAAKAQQAASDAAKTQQTAEEQRTSEEVARIIEAFTTDDGYVDEQKQKQLIYYHGEELFNRAVTEAFERGLITNDGRGNIYSLKAETRAPGYYGAKGKNAKYLDNLAKAAGMTIIRGNLSNGEQGFYINGRAVLAADAGVEIARHEVAHHLKQAAPEEFGEFMNYAKSVYGDKLDAALERIRSDYAAKGENLSAEVAEEELAAYFAGQLMTDETAMKRLAGENLSLAERLLDWIRKSLAKVGRALGMESTEAKQLREGAALFEKAIRAAKSGAVESDGAVRHAFEGYDPESGRGIYRSNFPEGTPKSAKAERILNLIQKVWSKEPIELTIEDDGEKRTILAEFDPDYDTSGNRQTDASKLMGGNRKGTGHERRVTLDLADDYPRLLAESKSTGNKAEIGKTTAPHIEATEWEYFANDILFKEFDSEEVNPYRVSIDVKKKPDGHFVYSYSAERSEKFEGEKKERQSTRRTLHADVNQSAQGREANAQPSDNSIPPSVGKSNTQMLKEEQFRIIQQSNPAEDSYHTWVRSVDDIRTLAEVVADPDWDGDEYDPDYTRKMAEDAIKRGKIKVYSSKPIGDGIFVTPSRMEAESYSSNGKVYSKVVGVDDVAWIDPTQGQYAPVGGRSANSSGKRSAYADTAEQLKEIQRLQRQNVRLSEQVTQLQNRVREAGRGTDRDSVKAQVKDLKKRYGSRVNTNELTDSIVALYDDMSANAISNEEMRQRADEIAQKLLDGSAQQINPLYDEYEELRKMLRSRRIHLSETDRADLDHVGGYNALRQKNMGRLMLAKDGVGVDVLYEELSEDYPELFPDDVYSPADQLIRISDVLDDLAAVEGNPFEQTPGARDFLAGDILERFFGTPQTYKAELQRDRAAMEQRLEKAKDEYRKRLEVIEKRHAAENQERRAKATASERREQLMKGTERLTKKLVRPDDKRHIPAEMRETVRAFVSMVNTESGYEYVFQRDGTYKRVKAGSDPYGVSTARTDRARELQAQLRKLEKDGGASIDPNLQANLDAIAEMQETKIADMNREQLDLVYETMRAIEKMCQNSDKMLGDSKFATVSKVANELLEESRGRKTKTQWIDKVQRADDFVELDMMTPETFFHKLGRAGDELFRQMRRSADKQTQILKEGTEHAKNAIAKSGLDIKALERETHEFELDSGEKLTMTTAQIMNLHEAWKREQARDHVGLGGIKPTKIESGKGLKATAAVISEKVTLNDLANILKVLTPEQKALVDDLQKFMSGDLARHGNEASRETYGYDKFTEPDYWPIAVNKAEVESDPAKAAQAKTIVGFGMAKATKPKASNGLEIGSFMDVYTKHLSEMATYASWLATSENLTRVNNFKFTDAEGKPTGQTVKTILEKLYGKGGDAYWQKLMGDIAQGTKADSDGTIFDWLTANTKAAAVGANIRVILQQPTSILRAASMIHPKYFIDKRHKGGWEKALKYSGIAQWKDWGYFEMDTGRSVRDLILGPKNKLARVREWTMAGAGWADSKTWGMLWNAVERETAAKHPELSGEAFYEAAAERFGEVIDRTQVVDSVLHRSQIMRKGGLNKMATSFMSEPMKTYNMVLRDIYDINAAADGSAKVRAKRKLVGTATALTASFVLNALAQSLVDALRDDDREQKYWEKFAEAYRGNFGGNFNPLSYVPYAKDIVSIVQGFDVTRMDMDAVENTVRAFRQFWKTVQDEKNKRNPQEDYEDKGSKTMLNAGFDLACELLVAVGLPLANVKRDLLAAINTAFSAARSYRMQYELDKILYDIDYSGSRVRWWKILYEASKDNWDDYEAIYYDMLEQGLSETQIKKGMESQLKEDYGVDSVNDLPFRWTPPDERSMFNSTSKQLCEIEGPKKELDLGWW